MNVICLQAVENISAEELIKKINKKKLVNPEPFMEKKERGRVMLFGEKVKTLRQYHRQQLVYAKNSPIDLWLETGVCIYNDKVLEQRDLYIYYPSGSEDAVEKLTEELVNSVPLVLVEPNLEARLQQKEGCYNPKKTLEYEEENLWNRMWPHFAVLVYTVSAAWARYLDNPTDRRLLRQLRVRLRWLRSLLSFFRPMLKAQGCKHWQEKLRTSGLQLGSLRELDVILMSLESLEVASKESSTELQKHFTKHRAAKLNSLKKDIILSKKTLELIRFSIWLQSQPLLPSFSRADFRKVTVKRLKKWNRKLIELAEKEDILKDMDKAHSVRIRIKKMRYVLLSLTEFGNNNAQLARQLKRLQDLLGIMHDDYVNGQLVKRLKGGDKKQREEAILFSGWESAKIESTKVTLEVLWQEFGLNLKEWKKGL